MVSNSHTETDRRLAALERKIARLYLDARKPLQKKLLEYFKAIDKYKKPEEEQQKRLAAGEIVPEQYRQWRIRTFLFEAQPRARYEKLLDELAEDIYRVNVAATQAAAKALPEIYALNYNEEAAEISEDGRTIDPIDAAAAALLLAARPTINRSKDIRWNRGNIHSCITGQIMIGAAFAVAAIEVIKRTTQTNYVNMLHKTRSFVTNAENSARQRVYVKAEMLGIQREKVWITQHDNRVRHEHNEVDGVSVPVNMPFIVGGEEMEYPGDMRASPHLWVNCRCHMKTVPVTAKKE